MQSLSFDSIPRDDLRTIQFLSNAKHLSMVFQFTSRVSANYLKKTVGILLRENGIKDDVMNRIAKDVSQILKNPNIIDKVSEILRHSIHPNMTEVQIISLLADITTIIRPSARNSGSADRYIAKVNGEKTVSPIRVGTILQKMFIKHTSETREELIYQEQLMFLLADLFKLKDEEGDENLGLADIYRRYFENNNEEEISKMKTEFWLRYKDVMSIPDLKEFWEFVVSMAGYLFNKSHAVSYAVLSYITAFMLANMPRYFLATCIPRCKDDAKTKKFEKIEKIIVDARGLGVEVVMPVINDSYACPTPDIDKEIIYLSADIINGVGTRVSAELALKNDFKSIEEFLNWASQRYTTKEDLETGEIKKTKVFDRTSYDLLAKVGFFKPLYPHLDFDNHYKEVVNTINDFSLITEEFKEKTLRKKDNQWVYKPKDNQKFREEIIDDYPESCKIRTHHIFLVDKLEMPKKINRLKWEEELLKFVLSNPFESFDLSKFNKSRWNDNDSCYEGQCLYFVKKVTSGVSNRLYKGKMQRSVWSRLWGYTMDTNITDDIYTNDGDMTKVYKHGDIIFIKYHTYGKENKISVDHHEKFTNIFL